MKKFYLDEPVVVSFFIGELGWFLQRYQAYFRSLKVNKYPNHKFILLIEKSLHPFVKDFVSHTIDLPQSFKDLKLDQDCYEAVIPGTEPGGLTPAGIYSNLIEYVRNFYNVEKAIELWPPRSGSRVLDYQPQLFAKYESDKQVFERPVITIFPRTRTRASERNVPEFVWKELVDTLVNSFLVVLAGTPNGACLGDYKDSRVQNLISYEGEDKTELILGYLNNSVCSISSQSGGTHISLLADCPSYIIGHEKDRHTIYENRHRTPTSFRYVVDYRMIDVQTIIQDVASFIHAMKKNEEKTMTSQNYDSIINNDTQKLNKMIRE